MSLVRSLFAFAAAAAVSASVSVGWATGVGTGSSAVDQDLPDLGSPATAAVSLEEEYRAGLGWFAGIRQSGQIIEDPEISDYIQQIGPQPVESRRGRPAPVLLFCDEGSGHQCPSRCRAGSLPSTAV